MEKIFSNVDPSKLLHIIIRSEDFEPGRTNIVPEEHFIQCATLNFEKGKIFKPHKHVYKKIERVLPQESWCIIKGKIKCIFYDIDDKIIAEPILNEGDASFSLDGGHNYLFLEDSKVFEFKVGPYLGQISDKIFISD